jgi:integrase/recombinase XerD
MVKAYLEVDEVRSLEESATNQRDRLLIRLLFFSGCRISEALPLSIDDVNLLHGTVTVRYFKLRIELSCSQCRAGLNKSYIYCPKCGLKVAKPVTEEKKHCQIRALPIDGDTQMMLKEYIESGGPVEREGKKLIFGINRHRGWQIVKECAERAGLSKLVNPKTGKVEGVSPRKLREASRRLRVEELNHDFTS